MEQVEGVEAWIRVPLNASGYAILVAVMTLWMLRKGVFAYDSFLKSGKSIIETQQLFRCRFNIGSHGIIPSRNTILK
jgi:hypothetical protein